MSMSTSIFSIGWLLCLLFCVWFFFKKNLSQDDGDDSFSIISQIRWLYIQVPSFICILICLHVFMCAYVIVRIKMQIISYFHFNWTELTFYLTKLLQLDILLFNIDIFWRFLELSKCRLYAICARAVLFSLPRKHFIQNTSNNNHWKKVTLMNRAR